MDQSVDQELLSHVLVPVATENDARVTAEQLAPYNPDHVTALHVVEKGGGTPDKTPVEQSEVIAEGSFAAVREEFPDADDTHGVRPGCRRSNLRCCRGSRR